MDKRGEVATLLLLVSAGIVLLGAALGIKDATSNPNPLKSTAQSACTFNSTFVIKGPNNQILPVNDISVHFKFADTNGKVYEGDTAAQNGKVQQNVTLEQRFIGVPVALTLKYNPQDYEVQGGFCNETPTETDRHSATAACNEWYGDKTQNKVVQTFRCGKTLEYGFIVKSLKATPTPMPPTRVRMKLQENNGHDGYYQCYVNNDSDTEKSALADSQAGAILNVTENIQNQRTLYGCTLGFHKAAIWM